MAVSQMELPVANTVNESNSDRNIEMTGRKIRPLAPGYTVEADGLDESIWNQHLPRFADANIFQTWSYAQIAEGEHNICNLVLRQHGEVVAIAQARVRQIPLLGAGVAYIRSGPLWRLQDRAPDVEVFRQVIRALRNELVCRRGLALRLYPRIFTEDALNLGSILVEEGFVEAKEERQERTILMDLKPSLEELRAGMPRHGRSNLRNAERQDLEIVEGCEEELFDRVLTLYSEMIARKKIVKSIDPKEFKRIQQRLPDALKMRIILCSLQGEPCAGVIFSRIGETGIPLVAATGDNGLQCRASFLVQWQMIASFKNMGASIYDMNGINPKKNPGSYSFKKDISGKYGREVSYQGRFDAAPDRMSRILLHLADWLKRRHREGKRPRAARAQKQEPLSH
jgi:hypothetical protein